jgi:hypothetical protein
MKIPDGEYEVVLNKHNQVSSCWRINKKRPTSLQLKNDFEKLDKKFID